MKNGMTVVVTGCSSGFGRLLAKDLLARGHRVFAGVRSEKDCNVELGPDALLLDVTSDASVDAAFAAVREKAGGVDVVVNNAGISSMGVAEGFAPAQLASLIDVNLLGASKAAVEALAETYRYELAPMGIESVIVQPGPYPTSLGANALAPRDSDRVACYGPLADLPAKMMAGLTEWFASPGAPNAQEVPTALVKLIEAPRGARPLRVVVGGTGSAGNELNALSDRLQAETLASQGLDSLLKLG